MCAGEYVYVCIMCGIVIIVIFLNFGSCEFGWVGFGFLVSC